MRFEELAKIMAAKSVWNRKNETQIGLTDAVQIASDCYRRFNDPFMLRRNRCRHSCN